MKGDVVIADEVVMSKIFLVRGYKVMVDRDLEKLYGVKAIRLREQVKRNQDRFPNNFMFQLDKEEVDNTVSQNAIPTKQHLGGSLPYAFTEHGVLVLATVVKSGDFGEYIPGEEKTGSPYFILTGLIIHSTNCQKSTNLPRHFQFAIAY